jgi:hypothetical protein
LRFDLCVVFVCARECSAAITERLERRELVHELLLDRRITQRQNKLAHADSIVEVVSSACESPHDAYVACDVRFRLFVWLVVQV